MHIRHTSASILFCLCFLTAGIPLRAIQGKERDLPVHYREFLDLTRYIALAEEQKVFLRLDSDRDRDAFIRTFWKQRDPTPGTPHNEYREEHLQRFNHANKFLGRGTPRAGWQTDQGRIYIILGPPVSIDRFLGSSDVYPAEVWSYYGDESKGLPAHFAVVFYKRRGAGEFVIYNPAADGPGSLLIRNEGFDPANYEQLYRQIEEVAPTLAPVVLSMIPGDIPFDFHPSLDSHQIMTSIFASPSRDVNVTYATHFLDYRGMVSTDYMTNYIESTAQLAVFPDPVLGLEFVHFAIVPERVSVDYFEARDQYYCNFKLTVSLRRDDEIILQYSKDLPVYIPPEELEIVLAHGLSIEDSFPVAQGEHRLIVLVQNSVQKEFCLYEQDIQVPAGTDEVRVYGPFVGFGFQDYAPDLHIPFKVGGKKLLLDPRSTFSRQDDFCVRTLLGNVSEALWRTARLEIRISGLRETDPSHKSFSRNLRDMPFGRVLNFESSFPVEELTPDYYTIRVSVIGGDGGEITQQEGRFIVSPEAEIPHPMANAKGFRHSDRFLYAYMLASQYDKLGDPVRAEARFTEGYTMRPEYQRGIVDFARFHLKAGNFEQSLALAERLREAESFRFEYHLIRGLAFQGMQEYDRAVESLLQGNAAYNADTELLNALGSCYDRIGEPQKALEVLRASLRLNPEQQGVRNLIARIEKKK
jgi:GWxTD domain-containing protein